MSHRAAYHWGLSPHEYVRGELSEKGDGLATLDEAMDITRTFETKKAYVAQFQSSESSSSATVRGLRRETMHEECTRCGRRHPAQGFCPAKGSTCRRCGRKHHWDTVCTATKQTLRSKVANIDINDRHLRGAPKRSHGSGESNGEHYTCISTNVLTSTRTRWCSRPSPYIWTAFETHKTESRQPEATASSPVKTHEETKCSPVREPEIRTTQDSSYTTTSQRRSSTSSRRREAGSYALVLLSSGMGTTRI